jgi:hypothetical protein
MPSGLVELLQGQFSGGEGELASILGRFRWWSLACLALPLFLFNCAIVKRTSGRVGGGCEGVYDNEFRLYSGYKVEFTSPCPFF